MGSFANYYDLLLAQLEFIWSYFSHVTGVIFPLIYLLNGHCSVDINIIINYSIHLLYLESINYSVWWCVLLLYRARFLTDEHLLQNHRFLVFSLFSTYKKLLCHVFMWILRIWIHNIAPLWGPPMANNSIRCNLFPVLEASCVDKRYPWEPWNNPGYTWFCFFGHSLLLQFSLEWCWIHLFLLFLPEVANGLFVTGF